MGLYKRGQVWWMCFTYKGEQKRFSTEATDKKVAEKIHHKVMTQVAEGKWFEKLPGEEKTFREMMEKYMKEYSERNKSLKSHIRDKSVLDHLNQFFGDFTLSNITPRLVSEYKTKRREEGAAPATVNKELILMGHAFNLAIKEWEWMKENPVSRVSREKVNNQIERWLTSKEEESLLAASPLWLQEIIIFAINTGLRQGEILNLRWMGLIFSGKPLPSLSRKIKARILCP